MKSNVQSAVILVVSSIASVLLTLSGTGYNTAGASIVFLLAALSLRNPWLGLLSLFPMLSAVSPAPRTIGLAEGSFALLASAGLFGSLIEEAKDTGWTRLARRYRIPIGLATAWAISNLLMASRNGVPLTDWVRGAAPFLFLIYALPLARALAGQPGRTAWVGWGTGVYLLLLTGLIVGYYLHNDMYMPYWTVDDGGVVRRIAADALTAYPGAVGPYIDRITMHLPRATTVMLAAGLVMSYVVAVRGGDCRVRMVAGMLAALNLLAVLLTYTRSMMIVAVGAALTFCGYLAWRDRRLLMRALTLLLLLSLWGGGVVETFGLGTTWFGRFAITRDSVKEVVKVEATDATHAQEIGDTTPRQGKSTVKAESQLRRISRAAKKIEDADVNVASRVQELRAAWARFRAHPLLGNGLGVKNLLIYVGPSGPVATRVAYIHNWVFYSLMVGGLLGFALYAWLLLAPAICGWRQMSDEPLIRQTFRFGILAFAAYGLTFAVFRHIDFNFFVAVAWATLLSQTGDVT